MAFDRLLLLLVDVCILVIICTVTTLIIQFQVLMINSAMSYSNYVINSDVSNNSSDSTKHMMKNIMNITNTLKEILDLIFSQCCLIQRSGFCVVYG